MTDVMEPGAMATNEKLVFKYFPAFASFILQSCLEEFVAANLTVARSIKLPLLKYYDFLSDTQLIELGIKSNTVLLTSIIENRLDEHIHLTIKQWVDDQLPLIARDKIVAEDITKASFLLKTVLLQFLPRYTADIDLTLTIVKEIDEYLQKRDAIAFSVFINIQRDSLNLFHQKLQNSEAKLLEAQEIAHMGSFEWDLIGRETYLSAELLRIFEIDGASKLSVFLENVHDDDKQRVDDAIQKAIKECGVYEAEYRYIKNGKEKEIWSKGVVTCENGRAHFMKGTVMDVTERNRLARKLKKTEALYKEMINEVQDYAILRLSKDGVIMNWNLGAEKIKGYKAEEAVGKKFSLFYTEEDKEAGYPERFLNEALINGRATHEGWRVRKDGTKFWSSVVLTALHDEAGNITGVTKVTRDLTEKKRKDDQLLDYSKQLEQKALELEQTNKELESFSYIASHDLQEPLRNVKIFSNLIQELEVAHMSDKGKQLFGRIVAACTRMQKLIEDLLSFSRVNAVAEQFEEVDLNQILEDIKTGYAESNQEIKPLIKSNILPVISGVSFQLRQLFENIISNSVKYSRADTPPVVTITAKIIDGEGITIHGGEVSKKYWQINFADNGIGFEQKYAPKIFEVFQRLHGKDEYSGTGIGLAICKKIVHGHKGVIYADGRPNEGATFSVCLPVSA